MNMHRCWLAGFIFLFTLGIAGAQAQGKAKDNKPVAYWVEQLKKNNRMAMEPLIKAGSEAAKPVAALLEHPNKYVQGSARKVLSGLGPQAKAAIPDIAAHLKNSNRGVRLVTLSCLVELGFHAREATAAAIPLLNDADRDVRQYAWSFLSESASDKSLVPLARKIVQEGTDENLGSAAWLIWRLDGNAKGSEVMAALLKRSAQNNIGGRMVDVGWLAPDSPEMAGEVAKIFEVKFRGSDLHRHLVLEILPTMGPEGKAIALKLIQNTLADPKSTVNRTALAVLQAHKLDDEFLLKSAIAELNRKYLPDPSSVVLILRRLGPKARDAVPKLEAMLQKSPNKLGFYQAIAAIDPARASSLRPEIEALQSKTKQGIDRVALDFLLYRIDKNKDYLEYAFKMLRGKNPYDAAVAAGQVRELGDSAKMFLPDIYKLLENPDSQARLGACAAIWDIEKDAARIMPILNKALANPKEAASAMSILTRMGPAGKGASAAVVEIFKTSAKVHRDSALNVLLAIDRPVALRVLKTGE